jgi:hypothetical protein
VAPKEKPASMSQDACDEEKCRCAIMTDDRKRRRLTAEAHKDEAARAVATTDVCLSLGSGPSDSGSASYPLTGRSASPSSLGYFAEAPSLS